MAEASVLLAQDQFSCPICLDLLKDPVGIPCGHSFCMDCITGCWDQEDLKGVYSCPQCRQSFTPRPVLGRNTMLAEVVEKLKLLGLQSAPAAHCYAGPGDVECDVCSGRKQKAVKSCLVCLSSYCETHFRSHNDLNPGKKHKVIDAAGKLEDLICSQHDKLLEVFCRTDQTCLCVLCVMDEHKEHDTVSVTAERTEKQRELGETQRKSQELIQEKENQLQDLREAVKTLQCSAQAAVDNSDRIFTEVIRSIKRRRSEVTNLIRDQERADVSRAEELMETLEQEIAELKRRVAELEQFSQSENNIRFLKVLLLYKCYILSQKHFFLPIKKREYHFKKNVFLTLDPTTAHNYLKLSEGNRTVQNVCVSHSYPDHPDRFSYAEQVMCREATSTRCYWEVERSGDVYIAVSYKGLKRKGKGHDVFLGRNNNSWSLYCSLSRFTLIHENKRTNLPCTQTSSRIGVYVDHRAGTLCFYSVSDTMTLLHKRELGETQRKSQEIIQEKENQLQDLREAVKTIQCSAQAAVENSERIFTEVIRSIERRRSEVTKLIRDQERADVSRAEELMETLEQEIAELKRRVAELDQFSQSENNIRFLKTFQSLCASTASDKSSRYSVHTDMLFERVNDNLTMLKDKLQDVLQQGLQDVTKTGISLICFFSIGEQTSIFIPSEPVTRKDFLKYSCQLTLDPTTANTFLRLSKGNTVVERVNVSQSYPDHPDRFSDAQQVMCREAASARCYWEVEWSGAVRIAVSYKGLKRKGHSNNVLLGHNINSWSLWCHLSGFIFIHDNKETDLPRAQTSSRIGVYVDYRAGTLCFYSVSGTMTLLHKVETTFTEPLHPAFWLGSDSKIKLC
ncbi:hypothetical protein ACEWY4_019055 [Coilia grayii]|uniref:Tripartite motif-containing protein 16-like n=1 Tax=Coilia grayii TaxID=363190 RepID=A0ABD1JGJ2_9TELE